VRKLEEADERLRAQEQAERKLREQKGDYEREDMSVDGFMKHTMERSRRE
jgi:hypothetical protein